MFTLSICYRENTEIITACPPKILSVLAVKGMAIHNEQDGGAVFREACAMLEISTSFDVLRRGKIQESVIKLNVDKVMKRSNAT